MPGRDHPCECTPGRAISGVSRTDAAPGRSRDKADRPVVSPILRIAEELQVPGKLADAWLKRFVEMKLRTLFESPSTCKTPAEVVEELRIPERQVRSCLKRLHDEGVVVKVPRSRPLKYRSAASIGPLFDKRD